jgi:hypothetical protein
MEFKKLSAVEMVEAVDQATTVLIEKDGVIKRAPKNEVNVQADWAETDSSSPAFIKNKPECDLDIEIVASYYSNEDDGDGFNIEYTVKSINTFNNIKNKVFGTSVPKCTAKLSSQQWGNTESPYAIEFIDGYVGYYPENYIGDGSPEFIQFSFYGNNVGYYAVLTSDDVFQGVFLN